MVNIIRDVEFLDENTSRNYPLTIESTGRDITDSFTIPDEFLADMTLVIPVGLSILPGKFFLRTLGNYPSGFSLIIGYDALGGPVNVAVANISRSGLQPYSTFRFIGLGDFIEATGHVTLGYVEMIDEQPAGQFEFALAGARLEPRVIHPMIRSLGPLRLQNGAEISDAIYGPVVLEAGSNMRLTLVQSGGTNTIVFDAIEGEGFNEDCLCEDDPGEGVPIRFINGVPGTAGGQFTLAPGKCIELDGIQNGLRIIDSCSAPCCGPEQLERITQDADLFGTEIRTLQQFMANLEGRIAQMEISVLGSRINDQGCQTC